MIEVETIRWLKMAYFWIWFSNIGIALFVRETNPIMVKLPVWVSRILFIKYLIKVPLEAVVLQVWLFIMIIATIISNYTHIVDLGFYVYLAFYTIMAMGIWAIGSAVIYSIKNRKIM